MIGVCPTPAAPPVGVSPPIWLSPPVGSPPPRFALPPIGVSPPQFAPHRGLPAAQRAGRPPDPRGSAALHAARRPASLPAALPPGGAARGLRGGREGTWGDRGRELGVLGGGGVLGGQWRADGGLVRSRVGIWDPAGVPGWLGGGLGGGPRVKLEVVGSNRGVLGDGWGSWGRGGSVGGPGKVPGGKWWSWGADGEPGGPGGGL